MNLKNALDIAVETAEAAGALLKEGLRGQKSIDRKSSAIDLVTEYDRAADALILERLQNHFPDHDFVAEESGNSNHSSDNGKIPYTWYIDPLDGTNNFAHGLPVFCVSIALYEGTRPLIGVVYDPMRQECFSAVQGQGAFLTTAEGVYRLQVSPTDSLLGSLLATGFPYDRHTSELDNVAQMRAFLKRVQGVRRAGAAALDLAYVAAGRLDGYWEFKLRSWDLAAGVLLVEEAGGRVTGPDGRTLIVGDMLTLVASNGLIQEEMLAVLAAA
jgi:myo-inositol-1(or 4)-monophosphatase